MKIETVFDIGDVILAEHSKDFPILKNPDEKEIWKIDYIHLTADGLSYGGLIENLGSRFQLSEREMIHKKEIEPK